METFNLEVITNFIKSAQAAGVPQERLEAFVAKKFTKTATEQLDQLITGILMEAGVEKTANSSACVEGILKAAVDNGLNDEQAIELAKVSLKQKEANMAQNKTVMNYEQEKLAAFAEGFMKTAMEVGFSEGQSWDLLNTKLAQNVHPQVKQANDMLKQIKELITQNPEIAGALGMGGLGAAAGAGLAGKGNRGKGALVGALGGGTIGALAGNAYGGGEMDKFTPDWLRKMLNRDMDQPAYPATQSPLQDAVQPPAPFDVNSTAGGSDPSGIEGMLPTPQTDAMRRKLLLQATGLQA